MGSGGKGGGRATIIGYDYYASFAGVAGYVSLCTSKCTIFLRFKMYHLEMLISLILSVCFVENFMAVCLRFC